MDKQKYEKLYELAWVMNKDSWMVGYAYSHDIDKLTSMVKGNGKHWTIESSPSKNVKATDPTRYPYYVIREVAFII